ncbi:hypothetical protein TNCV_577551 [Trichonephila clavipes]|nr:hypothetical protein TNCV_577551 [Trichonephila clavipes]
MVGKDTRAGSEDAACVWRKANKGLGLNAAEDLDVCNCKEPSRKGGILNNRKASSPLERLVDGEERGEAPDHLHVVLPQNWGETEQSRIVICMMLIAKANDRYNLMALHFKYDFWHMTATAGSDVVQSGRPIFDDFFQHLWPYIGNNTANVVFQMVKRLWLIRIDQ